MLGFLVGRWWALAAPLAFAVWIYVADSPVFLRGADISRGGVATVVGVWGVAAVVLGLFVRRFARRFVSPPS